ncbi:MAG TPA: hypothetical protein VNZ49_14200 [Bacteroidia bacterium]|jgi:hypothetical protein|nr:hypothetical protein [Bacteroidia bacterium]
MENREELVRTILNNFLSDLSASAKPLNREETINFIGVLAEYLKGVYNHEPSVPEYNYEGSPFDEEEFIETHLLKPYRQKMVPFVKTSLKYYFSKDEYGKTQLFNKLKIDEPLLNNEEYQEYILRVYTLLQKIKENLYLKPIEETKENPGEAQKLIDNPDELVIQGFKSKSKEYTRSRQILLFYYVLKLMGMTKLDTSTRKYAQFAHVLFAWPTDNVDNAGLYKMLKKAPYLKETDKAMLKDLEFIKNQFELIDSPEGVALVQKEIDSIKRT